MNFIELLFLIVCLWILYIGISFAFEDIREAEKELEEVKKQLNQEVEVYFESRNSAEMIATFQNEGTYIKCLPILELIAKENNCIITESIK